MVKLDFLVFVRMPVKKSFRHWTQICSCSNATPTRGNRECRLLDNSTYMQDIHTLTAHARDTRKYINTTSDGNLCYILFVLNERKANHYYRILINLK